MRDEGLTKGQQPPTPVLSTAWARRTKQLENRSKNQLVLRQMLSIATILASEFKRDVLH